MISQPHMNVMCASFICLLLMLSKNSIWSMMSPKNGRGRSLIRRLVNIAKLRAVVAGSSFEALLDRDECYVELEQSTGDVEVVATGGHALVDTTHLRQEAVKPHLMK